MCPVAFLLPINRHGSLILLDLHDRERRCEARINHATGDCTPVVFCCLGHG